MTDAANEQMVPFMTQLVAGVPALEQELVQHVDYFEAMLPHLLMGDVVRWAERTEEGGSASEIADLSTVMDRLEAGFVGGPHYVSELIAASFLEAIPRPGQPGSGLRRLLGRGCREHLSNYDL